MKHFENLLLFSSKDNRLKFKYEFTQLLIPIQDPHAIICKAQEISPLFLCKIRILYIVNEC